MLPHTRAAHELNAAPPSAFHVKHGESVIQVRHEFGWATCSLTRESVPHSCFTLGQLAPGTERVLPGSPEVLTSRHGPLSRSSFHVKRIVRRFDRAHAMEARPPAGRIPRPACAGPSIYFERFTLAASLMIRARSSEPRSPVVRFHVKRAGRERRVTGPMSGQRAPTPAIDGIARCGRRCHGRQYSDAAGPSPDLPNPFVLSS